MHTDRSRRDEAEEYTLPDRKLAADLLTGAEKEINDVATSQVSSDVRHLFPILEVSIS